MNSTSGIFSSKHSCLYNKHYKIIRYDEIRWTCFLNAQQTKIFKSVAYHKFSFSLSFRNLQPQFCVLLKFPLLPFLLLKCKDTFAIYCFRILNNLTFKLRSCLLILVVVRCQRISARKVFNSYSKLTCVQFLYKKRFSVVLSIMSSTELMKHVYWIEFYQIELYCLHLPRFSLAPLPSF